MIELGLSRIHRLLARVPLPWRAIHVAGTNGKGSTCAYISAMLEHYNKFTIKHNTLCNIKKPVLQTLRHGRFTSPHLIDRWDCISVNGTTVSESVFLHVEDAIKRRNADHDIGASEFELLTATAFEIFTKAELDVGVVEVGMGGRLDATNVIGQASDLDEPGSTGHDCFRAPPLVTTITSIGLDHQLFLGDTIGDIARQKAGIMKTGTPVVFDATDEVVNQVVHNQAQALVVMPSEILEVTTTTTAHDIWRQTLRVTMDPITESSGSPINARWSNDALALQSTWSALHRLGLLEELATDDKRELLDQLASIPKRTVWPGRLQDVNLKPLTGVDINALLDGAHNLEAARILSRHVHQQAHDQAVHWVIAMSAGKDIKGMLETVLRPGDVLSVVDFGSVDGMPWVKSASKSELRQAAASLDPHRIDMECPRELRPALCHVAQSAKASGRKVVIAGSLYLVGDVLRLLRQGAEH